MERKMGTDIHLQVEAREGGAWSVVRGLWPTRPYPTGAGGKTIWPDDNPTGRNYNVFAFLAGVRNGSGFAGVYRHEPITPVCAGRGLPYDHLEPVGLDDDDGYWWLGDHSFTHATLAELLAADWSLEFESRGTISFDQWSAWEKGTAPDSWSGGISGPNIVVHDDEISLIVGKTHHPGKQHYIRVQWKWQPLLRSGFYKWLHGPKVTALAEEYGAENVRVLMGFDS